MNVTKKQYDLAFLSVKSLISFPVSCPVKTLEEECCEFPFIYKGKTYASCTTKNHNRPWCSVTGNYDKNKKWGNCNSEKHNSTLYSLSFHSLLI